MSNTSNQNLSEQLGQLDQPVAVDAAAIVQRLRDRRNAWHRARSTIAKVGLAGFMMLGIGLYLYAVRFEKTHLADDLAASSVDLMPLVANGESLTDSSQSEYLRDKSRWDELAAERESFRQSIIDLKTEFAEVQRTAIGQRRAILIEKLSRTALQLPSDVAFD